MKTNRYRTLTKYKGIREDTQSGKYLVQKCIRGKRHSKTFDRLKDAVEWQRTFNPVFGSVEIVSDEKRDEETFGDLWDRYKEQHLANQQKSTIENRLELAKLFTEIIPLKLHEITPAVISELIAIKKKEAIRSENTRRKCFDQELKLLKAIFNWHIDLYDHTFSNPVTRQHKQLGKIVGKKQREKKMSLNELKAFFDELKLDHFFYDFATVQLFIAGRVQEVAGLQKKNVDFENLRILIKDVAVWRKKDKKFDFLKSTPKNGEERVIHMNDYVYQALERQFARSPRGSFVFSENGEPLSYRRIQYAYDSALKRCGLSDRFSGTHILRHSMATLTRQVTGSLEATQSITGHKDQRMVQHYARLDSEANRRTQVQIQNFLEQENFVGINKCEQKSDVTVSKCEQIGF